MLQQKPSRASGNLQETETGYVVGADIGGTSLRLALAGMDGKVLAKWKVSTAGIRDPHVVVRLIHEGVEASAAAKYAFAQPASRGCGRCAGRYGCGRGHRDCHVVSHGLARRSAARIAGGQPRCSGGSRKRCEYGGHCGKSDRRRPGNTGLCLSRRRHWNRRGHRAQRATLSRHELVRGRDWLHAGSRNLGEAGGKGASREPSRVLSAAKASRRNGRVAGAKTLPSFRETWSPPRYSIMRLRGMFLRKRFSTGRRRPWPTRSITSRSFSTARFLCWVAAWACTRPYGKQLRRFLRKGISECSQSWYAVRLGLTRR